MCNRDIKGYIIEGADQQGKTTVVNRFVKEGSLPSYKFGIPDSNFDFFEDYIKPFKDDYRVYDRSFVSEMVYSSVIPGRKCRVSRYEELVDYFRKEKFVFIFLERGNHEWIDREEEFDRSYSQKLKYEYRKVFEKIKCEKYFLDPENELDRSLIDNFVNNDFSERRLLQEIYRHDLWKMMVSCIFLNRTHRDVFDKIRCDFFYRYSSPYKLVNADESEVKDIISFLGFKNRRYENLKNFSEDFMNGVNIENCRGIGRYALDSYEIFFKGNIEVNPKDEKLKEYVLWRKSLEC